MIGFLTAVVFVAAGAAEPVGKQDVKPDAKADANAAPKADVKPDAKNVGKPDAKPEGKTKEDEGKVRGKESKRPTLLRKRDGRPTAGKSKLRKAVDAADAPDVTERPIPKPDDRPHRSDLDRDLLDELGRELDDAQEEEGDPLMRAGRRMRSVEERLARLDAEDETLDLQKQIVKDLEELLRQARNNKNNNRKNQNQQQKQSQKMTMQQQQQRQDAQSKANTQSRTAAERARAGRLARLKTGQAEMEKDVWGHLSDMMRQEMSQYAKDKFLPRYRDLLERYYSTIAKESTSRSN